MKAEKALKKESIESIGSTLKYPKPNILLIDLPEELYHNLQSGGFNVLNGSFGSIYEVEREKKYTPILLEYNLPKVKEQEIVIIDLSTKIKPIPKSDYTLVKEEEWYWANCNKGIIDPRPIIMKEHQKDFDRILDHGGFFIIFVDSSKELDVIKAKINILNELKGSPIKGLDNWSFLDILKYIEVKSDDGEEIKVEKCKHELSNFLERNIDKATYKAILRFTYVNLKENWHPLLYNKFDQVIGALITPHDYYKGYTLILPQIYNKTEFIFDLLNEIIPLISPELFPYLEKGKWIERDEYETSSVIKYRKEKLKIKKEAILKMKELEAKITEEKEKWEFLQGIITNSGDELVEDVRKCLELIGFNDVKDVDKEIEENDDEENKQEDLQIHDKYPTLLLEVKGVSGPHKESYTMQAVKFVHRRMKEWERTDIRGVCIINHYKNMPPIDRDNENVFTQPQIKDAKIQDITLLTTWDLFLLIKGMNENGWDPKYIRELFYKPGRMSRIPANYEYIGKIVNYWEIPEVVGVQISENKLRKGQKIGYLMSDGYLEEEVLSLQVENKDVEEALPEELAGIKTIYPKDILKNGIKVFVIKDD